ncbi:MAG: sugar ABC transporter permease [Devosia nanyangense]|uniref:Sugar ABC transporter permease n=1 Tax=Devosia nanyangense TaxID=1228055 RepID=A0A933NZC7_9HYPH|nr:sugar ABC transporter permease [Devosia nanyangense]
MAKTSYKTKAKWQRVALLTPGALLYGIFNFLPLLGLLALCLVDWPGIGPMKFVGLDNFLQLFGNPFYRDQLIKAFGQNLIFFAIIIGAMLVFGTFLALLLSFRTWGRNFYRSIFFLPYPLAGAAVAFLLELIVRTKGPLNVLIVQGLHLSGKPIGFLGDPLLALPTLAAFYSWHRMSFAIILILSAIVAVRVHLIEAAMLDGANRRQTLRAVVFPVLAPAFILIVVIVMVDVFNNADYTLLLMGPEGAPARATDIMGTFLFRSAFGGAATSVNVNFGMSAAIGLVTAVAILPAAIFLALRNLRKD